MHTRCILILAFAALMLFACATSSEPLTPPLHQNRPTVVPLRKSKTYSLLRTHINGRDVGWFMLDTGSNLSVIAKGAAARLNLPVEGQGQAHGIGGVEPFNFHTVESLSLSGFHLPVPKLAALNLWKMSRHGGVTMAGLIGFDALRREVFTLDQPAGRLVIGSSFDETASYVGPLIIHLNLPMIRAELGQGASGGRVVLLMLDTGADNELTLHRDVLRRWPDLLSVPIHSPGQSRGIGGSVAGQRSWIGQLKLFGIALKDVPTSIDPAPPSLSQGSPRVDGRIGNAILRHFTLTFDASHRRIAAVWRPDSPDNGR